MNAGTALRATAVTIAIAGAIDPSIAWSRREKPVVSVLAASARHQSLADQTARELDRDFVVVHGPDAGAAAVVVAGDRVPEGVEVGQAAAFALLPTDAVSIERFEVPERASLESRVPIVFLAHPPAGNSTLEARLRVNGLIVDRQTYALKTNEDTLAGTLTFTATSTGLARLQIEVAAGVTIASADAAIDVDRTSWKVLSFDPRPSWASTFVRRALEEDPRFVVTARVATAPGASTEVGPAPASLSDALGSFDLVMVGGPDALTTADVDRLEAFVRRGGSVCLLMDQLAGGPYERLIESTAWSGRQSADASTVESGAARLGQLKVTELALPTLTGGADTIASAGGRPVIWRTRLGSGAVIGSGALDAWRHRAAEGSDFTHFWQTLVADAAEASRTSTSVSLGRRIFRPGAPMTVRVTLDDPATAVRATSQVRARVEGASTSEVVRLWPERPGLFTGTQLAPRTPGVYRVVVDGTLASDARNSTSVQRAASFLVAADAAEVSEPALVEAWAASHGGIAVKYADFTALRAAIARVVQPPAHTANVFPLRSPWWIVPFALALTGEWWLRRRRGRP